MPARNRANIRRCWTGLPHWNQSIGDRRYIATAAALALKRDNRPLPGAIVAFSPLYDMEANGGTLESNAATDAFISRELAETAAALFLDGHSPTDPLANPLYSDPAGLQPIFLTCGSHEALQDNAERFAALARRAGVDVVLHIGDEMQHARPICRD